jgi:hypothetical protein
MGWLAANPAGPMDSLNSHQWATSALVKYPRALAVTELGWRGTRTFTSAGRTRRMRRCTLRHGQLEHGFRAIAREFAAVAREGIPRGSPTPDRYRISMSDGNGIGQAYL